MFEHRDDGTARPLWLVSERELERWLQSCDEAARAWLQSLRFRAERHQVVCLPDAAGSVRGAVLGLGALASIDALELWHVAGCADRLPAGPWKIATPLPKVAATAAALGWAYGQYRFDRYRSVTKTAGAGAPATLLPPEGADMDFVRRTADALSMARDMINTPAEDMTPERLAEQVLRVAAERGGLGQMLAGAALAREYPVVHAVGRAAAQAPRLADFTWGDERHPKVTLVGKGVCFDSGGLDIKNPAGMLLMKKDMGGAACALALARLVMDSRLPVRLRVLIPAVENAVGGNAFRPGDVLNTRKGLKVEVGNTDAEGRLILCDALAAADAEQPDLIIDLATLTGAARTALGPELPALFGTIPQTVEAVTRHGRALADPLWPMPLWAGYDDELSSKVADLNNVSTSPFAGAIIAALYLKRFVTATADWLHVDLYAWNGKERPGRPVGGEAQTVRALHSFLSERYG